MSDTTKKCPTCAEEIPADATTCQFCGAQFALTVIGYCMTCHEKREVDASGHCKVCGTIVVDQQVESRVLEEAPAPAPSSQPEPVAPAAPLEPATSEPISPPEPSKPPRRDSLTWLWVVFGIVTALVICLLTAGAVILSR